jgi:hypothetical protein
MRKFEAPRLEGPPGLGVNTTEGTAPHASREVCGASIA